MSLETQIEILNNQLRQVLLKIDEIYPPVPSGDTPITNVPAGTTTQDTTASQQVPASGSVELDINGMPWDERIHSGAKDSDGNHKKTTKGVWQKRKGVPPADFKKIESEIMATKEGEAAIHSSTAEMQSISEVGIPGNSNTVVAPGAGTAQPALVLPIPADVNAATQQDCINIAQVFAQIHGNDAMAIVLNAWHMASLNDLTPDLFGQFVNYMVAEDAKLTTA